MGVEKLRITGGEPLVRRGVDELIARLATIPGIRDVTLTTNGALLARMAQRLADAGLGRVTVSLDSLDDATFRAMNDVDFPVAEVLEGIDAALAAGSPPSRSTWSSSAGRTTTTSSRWPGTSAAPASSCASSSTWTSAPPTAGSWTRSCRRPRS